jgi:hypothetical protein
MKSQGSEQIPPRQPRLSTLKSVERWLSFYGFSIYGDFTDPKTGYQQPGQRDYTIEEAVKVAKLIRRGKVWNDQETDE